MTDETRARMSVAQKLRFLKPEERAKNSISKMGHPFWGLRHYGSEIRAKESAAHMGHKVLPESAAKMGAAHWKGGPVVAVRKHNAKRRLLGFVPLNVWFIGSEGHHVDDKQVIYMPLRLHRSIYHNQHTGQGMAQMNALAYNFLFKQGVEAAMAAKEKL